MALKKKPKDDIVIPPPPKPTFDAKTVREAKDKDLVLQSFPWENTDFYALLAMCEVIRANPVDMLLVLYRESMAFPSSTVWTDEDFKYIGIVGMNQFTQAAVIGTFYPEFITAVPGEFKPGSFKKWQEFARAYRHMMPGEQMPYIAEYFKNSPLYKQGKPFPNATSLHAANFNINASASTDPNKVFYVGPPKPATCYVPGSTPRKLTAEGQMAAYNLYCQNEGMDTDGDRRITLGDLPGFHDKIRNDTRYLALNERLRRVMTGNPTKVYGPGF